MCNMGWGKLGQDAKSGGNWLGFSNVLLLIMGVWGGGENAGEGGYKVTGGSKKIVEV